MNRKLLSSAFVIGSAVLAGCGGGYVAVGGPPPPRFGIVSVAPGPGYVWTEGYYDLHGSNWEWRPGRWQRAPRSGAVWVRPEWRHEGRNWKFHRGYWR